MFLLCKEILEFSVTAWWFHSIWLTGPAVEPIAVIESFLGVWWLQSGWIN